MATVVTTQVGPDGVLHLSLPLGAGGANRTVRVTVEPVDGPAPNTTDREAWLRFIARTAGSISDPTFERQPQGQLEERDSLP
jgi:hypothetical protein